jgi:hypothetical protein
MMNQEEPEQIFVSKGTGEIFILNDKGIQIDLENPVVRELKDYKYICQNNVFQIYQKKK